MTRSQHVPPVEAREFQIVVLATPEILDQIESLVCNEWSDDMGDLGRIEYLGITQGIPVESDSVAWAYDPKTGTRLSVDGRFKIEHTSEGWWLTMPDPAKGTAHVGPFRRLRETLYRANFHAEHDATCDILANPGALCASEVPDPEAD